MFALDLEPLIDFVIYGFSYGLPIGIALFVTVIMTLFITPGWWIVLPSLIAIAIGRCIKHLVFDRWVTELDDVG